MSSNFENALVKRSVSAVDDDCVLIRELWDLDHPDCPFVDYRYVPGQYLDRSVYMTPREYEECFGISLPLESNA